MTAETKRTNINVTFAMLYLDKSTHYTWVVRWDDRVYVVAHLSTSSNQAPFPLESVTLVLQGALGKLNYPVPRRL